MPPPFGEEYHELFFVLEETRQREFTPVVCLQLPAKIVWNHHSDGLGIADCLTSGTAHTVVLVFPAVGFPILTLANQLNNSCWTNYGTHGAGNAPVQVNFYLGVPKFSTFCFGRQIHFARSHFYHYFLPINTWTVFYRSRTTRSDASRGEQN